MALLKLQQWRADSPAGWSHVQTPSPWKAAHQAQPSICFLFHRVISLEYSCSHEEHYSFPSYNRAFRAATGAAAPFQSCFPSTWTMCQELPGSNSCFLIPAFTSRRKHGRPSKQATVPINSGIWTELYWKAQYNLPQRPSPSPRLKAEKFLSKAPLINTYWYLPPPVKGFELGEWFSLCGSDLWGRKKKNRTWTGPKQNSIHTNL